MEDAAHREDRNAVGLGAVQTVISASDALTTYHLGKRHAGKNHADVADLVRMLAVKDAERRAEQALLVIIQKNKVQYEDADFSPAAGRRAKVQAERFLAWVKESIAGARSRGE